MEEGGSYENPFAVEHKFMNLTNARTDMLNTVKRSFVLLITSINFGNDQDRSQLNPSSHPSIDDRLRLIYQPKIKQQLRGTANG